MWLTIKGGIMSNFLTTLKDDVLDTSVNESRKYTLITNSDGTVSFIDVTSYSTNGSTFTMGSINVQNGAINDLDDDSTSLVEIVDEYVNAIANKLTALGVSTLVTDTVDTFVSNIGTVSDTYYANGVSAVKVGTAVASNVLSGYTFTNSSSVGIAGTMVNRGAVSTTLSGGDSYTIPAGYHNGNGVIRTQGLSYTDVSITLSNGSASYSGSGSGIQLVYLVSTSVTLTNLSIGYSSTSFSVEAESSSSSGTLVVRYYHS